MSCSAHVERAVPLATGLTTSTLPAASGAYAAKAEDKGERYGSKVKRSLANVRGLGLQLVKWDGFTPRPLIDANGRIIAVLAGQPRNDAYRLAVERAFQTISDAAVEARFPAHAEAPARLVRRDERHRAHGRFADAVFALWAPRLYGYYRACDAQLRTRHPHLRRPFDHSVFFCVNFNFGRNVWTFKHRDILNLAFGWCAIQALGRFDATKGGHLILWDLGLVVEFPAGALILVPSADNRPFEPQAVSFAT
ncbi:hypothetical protein B0H14DRAFT_3471487 [Mycena olivaceomarginata]|nr:hypothetical protein B0H14DRAFT_3471487 [Mycena olivaceomarginata]